MLYQLLKVSSGTDFGYGRKALLFRAMPFLGMFLMLGPEDFGSIALHINHIREKLDNLAVKLP